MGAGNTDCTKCNTQKSQSFTEQLFTDPVALFTAITAFTTCILSFATCQLAKSTQIAAEAARDGVALGREEFNATHRARIKLRRIYIENPFGNETDATAVIEFSNVGDSAAKIIRITYDVWTTPVQDRMMGAADPSTDIDFNNEIVLIGQRIKEGPFKLNTFIGENFDMIRLSAFKIYLFGEIQYIDHGKREKTFTVRHTTFCRMFRPPSTMELETLGRFVDPIPPEPEHEYED